jgi:hypothetical protein
VRPTSCITIAGPARATSRAQSNACHSRADDRLESSGWVGRRLSVLRSSGRQQVIAALHFNGKYLRGREGGEGGREDGRRHEHARTSAAAAAAVAADVRPRGRELHSGAERARDGGPPLVGRRKTEKRDRTCRALSWERSCAPRSALEAPLYLFLAAEARTRGAAAPGSRRRASPRAAALLTAPRRSSPLLAASSRPPPRARASGRTNRGHRYLIALTDNGPSRHLSLSRARLYCPTTLRPPPTRGQQSVLFATIMAGDFPDFRPRTDDRIPRAIQPEARKSFKKIMRHRQIRPTGLAAPLVVAVETDNPGCCPRTSFSSLVHHPPHPPR